MFDFLNRILIMIISTVRIPKSFLVGPVAFVLFINSFSLIAQPLPDGDRPALVVGIVVDGMKYEWIDKYWNLFGEGGLKKLVRQGITFSDVAVPFLMADIGSSHAAISTGAPPALNGIVSARWYSRIGRTEVHCTDDFLVRTIGSTVVTGRHSPKQLLTPALSDVLLLSSSNKSRVVSVSLMPEASVLLAGHLQASCYWFNQPEGNWVTSSYYKDQLPAWVSQFNQRNSSGNLMTREWNLLLADNLYECCPPDDNPFETGFYNQFKTFPYKINRLRRQGLSQDYEILTQVPFGNTLTTDFAITALLEENLGKDQHPDILWISYTAINRLNQLFGPDSREVADALLRLDMDIQRLIYQVEESVGREKSLFVLSSTHGTSRDPDYSRFMKLPGGYFRYRNAMALLNSYLTAIYGEGTWIDNYINHQVYLNERIIEEKKIPFLEIQDQAARFLTHFEGVARAIPSDRFITGALTQAWGDLFQNSFHPDRTGDLVLILQPGWIEENNSDSDSGSPHSYDRQVPLIWYGWGLKAGIYERPVTILDIAPTLARILRISRPEGSAGKPLVELFNKPPL